MEEFTERIVSLIKSVPKGKVASYGQIAAMAGNPRAARRVAWVLHSLSRKENLPWHRIIGSGGRISLPPGAGMEEQRALLIMEGVAVKDSGKVDIKNSLWSGR